MRRYSFIDGNGNDRNARKLPLELIQQRQQLRPIEIRPLRCRLIVAAAARSLASVERVRRIRLDLDGANRSPATTHTHSIDLLR